MSEQVKRYWPAQVLTDRWEMGSMDEAADGDYVHWDDYDALHAEAEALRAENQRLRIAYDDQWTKARGLEGEIPGIAAELEAARGLIDQLRTGLRSLKESVFPDDPHGTVSMHEFIDSLLALAASPAPEVPGPRLPEQPKARPYDYRLPAQEAPKC